MAIFHCAPNFSEGRNADTLDALREAARAPGVILADLSADPDHNRCVATLLGDADGLERAALQMARVAVNRIDLSDHVGAHPFLGALDVLPFVPFRSATMRDAVALSKRAARLIADALGLPVYLYAHSASDPSRVQLPDLRRGGWPGLAERLRLAPPDYGPPAPHPTAGACVVGARDPLIAWNVDLESADLPTARRIAARIRGSAGGLPGVRALGLVLPHRGCAQVSVNVTDPDAVTLMAVFRAVERLAREEGARVRGAELVGGIALRYVVDALNEATGARVKVSQVLDAWLPPLFE